MSATQSSTVTTQPATLIKGLTPAVRVYLYGVLAAAMAVLVAYGLLDSSQVAVWSGLALAVLGLGTAAAHTQTGAEVHVVETEVPVVTTQVETVEVPAPVDAQQIAAQVAKAVIPAAAAGTPSPVPEDAPVEDPAEPYQAQHTAAPAVVVGETSETVVA